MIWFTFLAGVYDTPKREFACRSCLIIIIGTCFDIDVLRHISLGPCEHDFGMVRQNINKFTISQMMDLIDGFMRRTKLIIKCNFKWGNDETKGHQATMKEFMVKDSHNASKKGLCKINCTSKVSVSV